MVCSRFVLRGPCIYSRILTYLRNTLCNNSYVSQGLSGRPAYVYSGALSCLCQNKTQTAERMVRYSTLLYCSMTIIALQLRSMTTSGWASGSECRTYLHTYHSGTRNSAEYAELRAWNTCGFYLTVGPFCTHRTHCTDMILFHHFCLVVLLRRVS